jgi:hypothetical protein
MGVKLPPIVVITAIIVVALYGFRIYMNATTSVTLNNPTGGTATLYTAIANGQMPDGSTNWIRNAACVAAPHTSCSAEVYEHRSIHLLVVTQYIFLGSVAAPDQLVRDDAPNILSAYHSTSDSNCCYMAASQ